MKFSYQHIDRRLLLLTFILLFFHSNSHAAKSDGFFADGDSKSRLSVQQVQSLNFGFLSKTVQHKSSKVVILPKVSGKIDAENVSFFESPMVGIHKIKGQPYSQFEISVDSYVQRSAGVQARLVSEPEKFGYLDGRGEAIVYIGGSLVIPPRVQKVEVGLEYELTVRYLD